MSASEIAATFERTCRDRRSEVAVGWLPESRALTFADLSDRYDRLCGVLQRLDLRAGACVVSAVGNHPVFFPLVAACMATGAALLPVGEATDAELVAIAHNAHADAIVTGRSPALGTTEVCAIDGAVSLYRLPDPAVRREYGRSVVVKLTSGSTDLPKATLTGERALLDDAQSIATAMGIGPRDANLVFIPLSHAYAIGNVVMPLLMQGTRAYLGSAFTPSRFAPDARDTGATVFPGVPFMFDRLRDAPGSRTLPATLRLLVTAGAPIDPATVAWFHSEARRKIHSFYGTSETGGITFDETDDLSDPLHVGRPMPGVTIELLDERAAGAGGRVFVRSGGLANGYAGPDPEAAFHDGGFRTSDLGYLTPAGQLVLTGRVSPLVNVAGRKVDPSEIERVLIALPEVADARVVGVDSATRGQELVAFVIPAGAGATPLGLRQACAATLSPYKIPRRFIFTDRWPVTERGKVNRRELEALALHDESRELTLD